MVIFKECEKNLPDLLYVQTEMPADLLVRGSCGSVGGDSGGGELSHARD